MHTDQLKAATCPACTASLEGAAGYTVHERMFGSGEPFDYLQCPQCGARVIEREPDDLARHYPAGYRFTPEMGRLRWAKLRVWPDDKWRAVAKLRPRRDWRILDVGCGNGEFLCDLRLRGFTSLTGVDPFLPADYPDPPGIRIIRGELGDVDDRPYDLVMLHHVIEHTASPVDMLRAAGRLLGPSGRMLVRTPLADSWASETYGPEWSQHDAPRHLVVHTSASMDAAATRAGLRVVRSWRDTGGAQLWASAEQARGADGHRPAPWRLRIARARYSLRAARLNREGRGDLGCFVITRA